MRWRSHYLEVEDAGVVVTEALVGGNDSGHHVLIQRQRGDGRQQPAVTWTDRKTLRSFVSTQQHRFNAGRIIVKRYSGPRGTERVDPSLCPKSL